MTKIISSSVATLTALATLLALTPFAIAQDKMEAESRGGATVMVPEHAIEKAPGLYYLGEAYDADSDGMVEGYMIVHPRDGKAKGGNRGGKPGGDTGSGSATAACYGFISKGAVWKTVEPWVVDPTNVEGLASNTVFDIIDGGINKWEDATDGVMDGQGVNVLGNGSISTTGVLADTESTDGKNEVHFGDLGSNTIGVTIVWGYFSGPSRFRELVEWDQVYNQADFNWSAEAGGVAGQMDFDSIATHELGHAMGLDDLYDSNCSDMTMYGYGYTGDTKARSLEDGDINGMNALY